VKTSLFYVIEMVIITGTSKGIGKAITETYLKLGQKVIGIGRSNTIEHPNYIHILCDLNDPMAVRNIEIASFIQEEDLIFIHNAGVLGEIKRFSDQSTSSLSSTFQVNLFSGAEILQQLLKKCSLDQSLKIMFISSGAGKRPIPSWAGYCASKAAVDLFIQTIHLEELEKGRSQFLCYSFAPGVVDTAMQEHIRSISPSEFSSQNQFKTLKENGSLNTPESVALTIVKLLSMNEQQAIICSKGELDNQ
jgi:benzil reductase ((S)-benzoin forming)